MIATRLVSQMPAAASLRVQTSAAAVLTGPRELRLEMVPRSVPRRREVQIAVMGSFTCATYLGDAWRGAPGWRYPLASGEPGGEVWGRIEAVGEAVTEFAVGQPVAAMVSRGFAEHAVAPAERVVALPAEPLREDQPWPALSLGRAINAWRRLDVRPGDRVAVLGMGLVGAAIVQLARQDGVEVVAISRRPNGLQTAVRCGARRGLALSRMDQAERAARRLTRGEGFSHVVEASGAGGPTRLAGRVVATGGTLMIVGGTTALSTDHSPAEVWRRRDVRLLSGCVRHPTAAVEHMRRAVQALADDRFDLAKLPLRRLPLHRLADAMRQSVGQQSEGRRAWICPS